MKTKLDPRHQKRVKLIQELFAWQYNPQLNLTSKEARQIMENLSTIDSLVKTSAPEWPIMQINKIDLAILRLAIYELMIDQTQPIKVIVDEAVELAKEFGSDSSAGFINGVLGKIINNQQNLKKGGE